MSTEKFKSTGTLKYNGGCGRKHDKKRLVTSLEM